MGLVFCPNLLKGSHILQVFVCSLSQCSELAVQRFINCLETSALSVHSTRDSNNPAVNSFNLLFTLAGFMSVIWIRRLGMNLTY